MLGIIAGLWTAAALSIYTLYSKFAHKIQYLGSFSYGFFRFSVVIGGVSAID